MWLVVYFVHVYLLHLIYGEIINLIKVKKLTIKIFIPLIFYLLFFIRLVYICCFMEG